MDIQAKREEVAKQAHYANYGCSIISTISIILSIIGLIIGNINLVVALTIHAIAITLSFIAVNVTSTTALIKANFHDDEYVERVYDLLCK